MTDKERYNKLLEVAVSMLVARDEVLFSGGMSDEQASRRRAYYHTKLVEEVNHDAQRTNNE